MREYELVAVLRPDVAEEDAIVEHIRQLITGQGGEVVNLDQWGRRKLAYPINRYGEGTYVVTQFRLDPQQITELEAGLKLSEDILRHLVVRREGDKLTEMPVRGSAASVAAEEEMAHGGDSQGADYR